MSSRVRLALALVLLVLVFGGGESGPAKPNDAMFLKGMLVGMSDGVEKNPGEFANMGQFESYRNRVVAKAKAERGSVSGSESLGETLGPALNELPFVLKDADRSSLVEILRKGAE